MAMDFFHCKFQVRRQGSDYRLTRDGFTGMAELFLSQKGPWPFSIGSAREDYIQMKGLSPGHVFFCFEGERLSFEARDRFSLAQGNEKWEMRPGEKRVFDLSNTLKSFVWEMRFRGKNRVGGQISPEEGPLDSKARYYLEAQYGPIVKIQEGASSLIFKTQDDKAIKILKPGYLKENPNTARRFINSARRLQRIIHPEFLPIYEIGYQKELDLCYVVTPFFPGESLKNYLVRKGPLPLPEARQIVRNIAEKLAILHRYGYVCRNLTPGNLLRGYDGKMRITSFFLMKTDVSMTVNARMVIPNYTAPEQVDNPACVDICADIFSLGAIFYTILLGEPPFNSVTVRQYIDSVNAGASIEAKEIEEIAPHLSEEVARQIAQILSFDKNKRPDLPTLISWMSEEKEKDPLSESCMNLIDASYLDSSGEMQKAVMKTPSIEMESGKEAPEAKKSSSDPSDLFSDHVMDLIDQTSDDEKAEQEGNLELPVENKSAPDITPTFFLLLERVDREVQLPVKKSRSGYSIEIVSGPPGTELLEYNFLEDRTINVGREGNIRLLYDTNVSRNHAQLKLHRGKCCLIDLDSANGTFVEGRRITETEISPGTRFTLGNTVLVFKGNQESMGGILENSEEELTEADITQLKFLKISSFFSPQPEGVALPDSLEVKRNSPPKSTEREIQRESSQKLQAVYERLLEEQARKTAKKDQEKRHPRGKEKREGRKNLSLLASVGGAALLLVLLAFSFCGESRPKDLQTNQPHENRPEQDPNVPIVPQQPSLFSIMGQVTKIVYHENRIQYVVLEQKGQEYAVLLSKCSKKTIDMVEIAYNTKIPIGFSGVKCTLSKGTFALDRQGATNEYLKPIEIECGGKKFKPDE